MKTWCKHIKIERFYQGWKYFRTYAYEGIEVLRHGWTCCPICQRERPTRANLAVALNRELQDGEQ